MPYKRVAWITGGLLLTLFGLVVLFNPVWSTGWLMTCLGIVLVVVGLSRAYLAYKDQLRAAIRGWSVGGALLMALFGLMLAAAPMIPVISLGVFFGVCLVALSAHTFGTALLERRARYAYGRSLGMALALLALGIWILAQPSVTAVLLGVPIGLSVTLIGLYILWDGWKA